MGKGQRSPVRRDILRLVACSCALALFSAAGTLPASPSDDSTKAALREELSRRLKKNPIIERIDPSAADPAVARVYVRNGEISYIDIDVTNLYHAVQGLPSRQRDERLEKLVQRILEFAASSSPAKR